jgi:hypothetical protein
MQIIGRCRQLEAAFPFITGRALCNFRGIMCVLERRFSLMLSVRKTNLSCVYICTAQSAAAVTN